VPSDYTAVSYFYLENPPADGPRLADAAGRGVSDPAKVIFVPGWNEPIAAFSFENMSLRKQVMKVSGGDVRVLSIQAQGEEMFGPHYIAFTVQIPKAGDYAVSLEALHGPSQGTVQLVYNNVPAGKPYSFAAPVLAAGAAAELGTIALKSGENQLFFRLASEPESPAPFRVDMIRIICTRK
jgi:hypothetical protein